MNARGQIVVALLSDTLRMDYLRQSLETAFGQDGQTVELRRVDPEHGVAALGDGAEVDIALCWEPPAGLWHLMPNVRLVQSLAAGVDHILGDSSFPSQLPLARIRDPHMASAMAAYVAWAVTSEHRQVDGYLHNQALAVWGTPVVTPATQYKVGIAGMGTLGSHCAKVLAAIGYNVRGWSRNPSSDPVNGCSYYAGEAGRAPFLAGLHALVCLLPLTEQTRGFMNRDCFARMSPGAHIVNVGRGAHLVESDLLRALDEGQLGKATLDAFVTEPLPPSDPLWRHPKVRITPHIATRTAAPVIAAQTAMHWRQVAAGRSPDHAVDVSQGY